MIRIGILGTDNSHAASFCRLFNGPGKTDRVPGGRVVAVFGLDKARTLEVARAGQVPTIVNRPEDMIGLIDAAIVDFRHGSRHLRYAKPVIQAGIPTFVDKPFTASIADAQALVALAQQYRVPITSFSILRFGTGLSQFKKAVHQLGPVKVVVVAGPGNARDPHDGIFFYAVHQVELILEVFGDDVQSVRGVERAGTLIASLHYRQGMIATIHVTNAKYSTWTATAFGEQGRASYDSASSPDFSRLGTRAVLRMFQTGQMPYNFAALTASTRILAAIQRSIRKSGARVPVPLLTA